jgi:hypothetical protein
MFKRPKAPKLPDPPPPVPTIDQARQRSDEEFRRGRRRGRAAYVMAGKTQQAAPVVGGKTLTGS